MKKKERFYELGQFFGGYFHQDWKLDASDWQSVVQRFLQDSLPDEVRTVATQLGILLAKNLDEESLGDVVLDMDGNRPHPQMTYYAWLSAIHQILREAVARNKASEARGGTVAPGEPDKPDEPGRR
jgi:hypothetical protein